MSAIEVKNLSKSFEYYKKEVGLKSSFRNLFKREKLLKEAVKSISFNIEEGEIVGFLGPNGAGKTTTLKILSGILHPSEGRASVLGFTPWERKKEFKRMFSIVLGQKNQLWPDLPANESLYLNKYIYELEDKEYNETLNELAELLDVKDVLKVQVRRLSLGERMKIELIAALLHRPRVIYLDEPTIGLDIISQKKIRDFLKHYNQEQKATIILTSHYMKDIEDLCKRAVIINQGRIVYDDLLNKINNVFSDKKIVKLHMSDYVGREKLVRFGHIKEHDGFNITIEMDRGKTTLILKEILENMPISDFNIEDIPIEEGISCLYKKHEENQA